MFAGTNNGIYRLVGNYWDKDNHFGNSAFHDLDVYCIEFVNGAWNAGTSDGIFYLSGNDWQKSTNFGNHDVYCFTAGMAGTSDGLYYQGGGRWNKSENFPSNDDVRCIDGVGAIFNAGTS
ncbi:hypothetical protein [Shewanella surugensis]|uniref:Uncharacterized protein n=1 Tax=Shewanella surugensis TaxID=212020 RepID=A0ABT0LKD7_9GAMM|nr:hypothetical protein [Shewanella surugensis]MCL1127935.1 hypothetical protein [Shewanella surugensis]